MIFKSLRTLHSAQCGHSCVCYVNRTEREWENVSVSANSKYIDFFYAGMGVWKATSVLTGLCVCMCVSV